MGKVWFACLFVLLQIVDFHKCEFCCDISGLTPSCKESCNKMLPSGEDGNGLLDLMHYGDTLARCPRENIDFWLCINSTFSVQPGGQWWGRSCCELSLTAQCKNACHRAKSDDELGPHCKRGDELAVFSCLDKHKEGQRCCQGAKTSQCRAVCKSVFIQDYPPTDSQQQVAFTQCNASVVECMESHFQTIPARKRSDSLPCCDHTDSDECRNHCRLALETYVEEDEIVDEVSKYCGLPNPSRPLWQCFLRSSTNNIRHQYNHGGSIDVTGIDGAKLQCCAKAAKKRCRDLCERTYSRGWTETVNEFHQNCSYHFHERDLNACLEDVEERCQLGCNELSFCLNFNYRPTELFRRCSSQADAEAKKTIELWKRGFISMPMLVSYDIPVKNIATCQPNKWKAIACILQIKPCHSRGRQADWICKADCISILSECLDTKRVQVGVTPQVICNMLSLTDDDSGSCISLSQYLVRSHHESEHKEVTTPCNPNPCNASHICEVVRHKCFPGRPCMPYVCRPGCSMGEIVTQIVPYNSYVKIPASPSDNQIACYHICKCGVHGLLHHCIRNIGCMKGTTNHCLLNSGMIHSHGTKFHLGCNTCVCHNREIICTIRHCTRRAASKDALPANTGLPCNCTQRYKPVCASNGQTFPNICLAKCNGFNVTHAGSCPSTDPCRSYPCSGSDICLRRPQICLGNKLQSGQCRQYDCVKKTECEREGSSPICDTNGEELPSSCQLISGNRTMAYHGPCKSNCRIRGKVCGVNGVTYASECIAWSNGVPVDYFGACSAVGQLTNSASLEPTCPKISCPIRKLTPGCHLITPPGACCPICAGEIRILISEKQLSEASSQSDPVTVGQVLSVLRLQMSLVECDVFAYPGIEGDLVILVMPVNSSPTQLQIEACMSETDKLASLVTSGSPLVTTFVSVSAFAAVDVRTYRNSLPQASSDAIQPLAGFLLPTVFLLFLR